MDGSSPRLGAIKLPCGPWRGPAMMGALALICLLALPGAALAASDSNGKSTAAEPPEVGSITGSVTDESGNPLASICVQAEQASPPFQFHFSMTMADGSYELANLPAGDYLVLFGDCGNHNVIAEYYDDQLDFHQADLVSVTAGQTTSGIDAQLAEGGRITGVVTDEGGTPLEDICVDVFDREDPSDEIAATDTGPDGSYEASRPPHRRVRGPVRGL